MQVNISYLHHLREYYDSGQFPDGLIAQVVGYCTSITEVIGSNPVQSWIFFRLQFHNCLSWWMYNCDYQSCLHIFLRISNFMWSVISYIPMNFPNLLPQIETSTVQMSLCFFLFSGLDKLKTGLFPCRLLRPGSGYTILQHTHWHSSKQAFFRPGSKCFHPFLASPNHRLPKLKIRSVFDSLCI